MTIHMSLLVECLVFLPNYRNTEILVYPLLMVHDELHTRDDSVLRKVVNSKLIDSIWIDQVALTMVQYDIQRRYTNQQYYQR